MQVFLIILIALAVLGAVAALVRGVVYFLMTSKQDLMGPGRNESSIKQNKMMQARILFQAVAIILVVLLLLLSRTS